MTGYASLRLIALALGVVATGGAALAQNASCQRYRAELASLARGGGSSSAGAEAQRQRHEIVRMAGYYRSAGCDGSTFSFFGPPPECGAIAQRIRMMEANYAQLASQAAQVDPARLAARRRQLVAAVAQACQLQREAADREDDEDRPARTRAVGGKRLVCVKTCDGSFFPLENASDTRESPDTLCKALCPGAEAVAFSMPAGDGEIGQALSLRGKAYADLPNAFKFRKAAADSSCSCRKPGQSWVEALQKAESLLERRRGDLIVTERKAEELSRPKLGASTLKTLRALAKPADKTPPEAYASQKTGAAETAKPADTSTLVVTVAASGEVSAQADAAGQAANQTPRPVRIVAPGLIATSN